MTLLQIVSDAALEKDSGRSLSFFDLIAEGGFMMIPIGLLFLLSIYLIIERFVQINKADVDPENFMARIKELILNGDIKGAKVFCTETNAPVSRVVEKGIGRLGSPLSAIEVSMQNTARMELFGLERNLSLLATVSGAAPMLGFLGTIIGMVKTFIAISAETGSVSPRMLTAGIYTAMVSTIAGLIVGIIAYLAYNYFVSVVQKIGHKMEYTAVDFMDLLQEPR